MPEDAAEEAAAINARLGTPELLTERPLLAELREVSPIKAGWAARAHRWAVHAPTIPEVLDQFEQAAAMHALINARIREERAAAASKPAAHLTDDSQPE